ncbi:MAG: hypothetical protein UT30_C0009G0021 [Candidatus Uhrbacteria bacterium GW2011_GWF2_39_13]|uniref:Response regulatory domain-containing protein n=1 Tax=Candidatus Uhrbacteria bacterium GW2011_GWF2_39_13 TaxID=1618995 RepID=A0A0G0MV53_9BACT|nr:MAG: hypothetical protein UT30_C0009G0021 [Candidatus Uhrbacteria bacterium GW2011_GWF2_39_13]HAU65750.1 hypothetical protein [Candidatus Uhrbacteria bacterium]
MYKTIVEENQSALGFWFKTALDVAVILDHPVTQMKRNDHGWSGPLEERIRAFNLLCAIFVKVSLEPSVMEEALWRASLPHVWDAKKHEQATERVKGVRSVVHRHLKGNKNAAALQARALMETLVLFPECSGYNGINMANIMAMLNRLVVDELGLDPIRPDYAQIGIPQPISEGPKTASCVLVVDDRVPELIKSALALVGIPNLEVQFLHYETYSFSKLLGKALDDKLEELANAVGSLNPNIVLMDQGLGDIEGSQLVAKIKDLGGKQPIFVANTGGDQEALRRVGCYENFEKGINPRGLLMALRGLD